MRARSSVEPAFARRRNPDRGRGLRCVDDCRALAGLADYPFRQSESTVLTIDSAAAEATTVFWPDLAPGGVQIGPVSPKNATCTVIPFTTERQSDAAVVRPFLRRLPSHRSSGWQGLTRTMFGVMRSRRDPLVGGRAHSPGGKNADPVPPGQRVDSCADRGDGLLLRIQPSLRRT